MALRTLQQSASDKNILVGLSKTGQKENAKINPKDDKLPKREGLENDYSDSTSKAVYKKNKRKQESVTQMLVNRKASKSYWKALAESRTTALEAALKENESLRERIAALEARLEETESLREQLEVLETENAQLKERNEENDQLLELIAKHSTLDQNSEEETAE